MSDRVYIDPESVQDSINWSWDTLISLAAAMGRAWRNDPDKWETDQDYPGRDIGDAPPDGYEALGPWEPIGCGLHNGRVNGGVEDMETVVVWRRPLRKIKGGAA